MTPESELAKKISLGLRLGQALGPDYDGSSLAEACEALLAALDAERAQVLEDREEVSALQTKLAEARSALQAIQDTLRDYLQAHEADIAMGVNDFGELRSLLVLLAAPSPARPQEEKSTR